MSTDPNPARRQRVNAALARAIGWTHSGDYYRPPEGHPEHEIYPRGQLYGYPDFYEDAAASRELCAWLAAQRRDGGMGASRWKAFCDALLPKTKYLPTAMDIVAESLTAPLAAIAEAAFAAIGGDDEPRPT